MDEKKIEIQNISYLAQVLNSNVSVVELYHSDYPQPRLIVAGKAFFEYLIEGKPINQIFDLNKQERRFLLSGIWEDTPQNYEMRRLSNNDRIMKQLYTLSQELEINFSVVGSVAMSIRGILERQPLGLDIVLFSGHDFWNRLKKHYQFSFWQEFEDDPFNHEHVRRYAQYRRDGVEINVWLTDEAIPCDHYNLTYHYEYNKGTTIVSSDREFQISVANLDYLYAMKHHKLALMISDWILLSNDHELETIKTMNGLSKNIYKHNQDLVALKSRIESTFVIDDILSEE